jgi:hypothetical protein
MLNELRYLRCWCGVEEEQEERLNRKDKQVRS